MKKLAVILGVLVALLFVVYLVVTSSGFLKSMVLPRVGAVLNARVDAESISVSPFSSVEVRKLTVVPNGAEPLASVDTVRLRYSLMAILGGRMAVDEIYLGSPSVSLVQKADGTSNLDPILKQMAQGAAAPAGSPAPAPGSAKPVQLDLKSFKLEYASVTYRATARDGSSMSADVQGLGISVQDLKNAGKGRIEVTSGLKFEQRAAASAGAPAVANAVQASIKGAFDLGLAADLAPSALGGKLEAQLQQASGAFKDFQGFAAVVGTDFVPGDLKRLAVEFSRQGAAFGSISAKGPLDLARKEAKLQLDVSAIDRNVLNLFGAAAGLDFTTTRFDSANQVELMAGGQKVGIAGSLTGTKVAVKKGDLVMPSLDLKESYELAVDLGSKVATVKAFSLSGNQGGREILRGTLSQPMQVSWAPNAGALPDAAVNLQVADLRLADWSAFAGGPLLGNFNAKADLGVKGGGKDFGFEMTAGLAAFSGTFASNAVRNLGFTASLKGAAASFADAPKRRLTVAGELKDLSGEAAVLKFDAYAVAFSADLGLPEGEVVISDLQVRPRQSTQEGGAIAVKGRWNTVKGAGEVTVTARDVNENALRPFLQVALGDKQLRSVKLVAELSTKVDPTAELAVKGSAEVKDLVVKDPSGLVPEAPLAAGVSLDLSGSASKLAVRQGELRLSPTPRGRNIASLTGDLDLSKTNALKGAFKLSSESMDVTPFFDLFTGGSPKTAAVPAPSAPGPGSTPGKPTTAPAPSKEPDAVKLPIDSFVFEAGVGKFFLREVAAENFLTTLKITGSRVEVQPLQLALNGAPIKAGLKLDLGVPGFDYDLNASAVAIPVKPFANSFVPMLKDRIDGAFNVDAKVKGAGITGVSLQKTLSGGVGFSVTNANLRINDPSQKGGILTMLVGLLANSLNIRELQDQPIMDILTTVKLGDGKIDITTARARSASLEVGTTGAIPISSELMQSPLNFPVNVSLARALAQRARLMPSDTPTNAAYVPIPPIATLKGTLGAPAPEVDKIKAGLLVARGLGGLVSGRGGDAVTGVADLVSGVSKGGPDAVGNLIQGIGNLLGGGKNTGGNSAAPAPQAPAGQTPAASPAPNTGGGTGIGTGPTKSAAPATNAVAPKATGGTSTTATTNTNAPKASVTNAPPPNLSTNGPLGGLLKDLLGNEKKKP